MTYHATLINADEGFAAICDELPGCVSQGASREEALRNLKEAMVLWLEVAAEDTARQLDADGVIYTREAFTV
jgi:predicted RNase H-like HicB family nuclease